MTTAPASQPAWLSDYQALTQSVGFVPLGRTQIELSGKDRGAFLHNLCTNEIKKLVVGSGCEAFITSVQGKTLGHVLVFAEPDSLILDTVGGQSETLLKHLDHYLVCENVVLADRTEDWFELLLSGPNAEPILSEQWHVALPTSRLAHVSINVDRRPIHIRRIDMTAGGGFLISVAQNDSDWLKLQLKEAGAIECATAAFEAARIEHGTPLFGHDISDKNLPQELARDDQAISFVKGCYLGQETVARIDALGHVNRLLVGIRFAGKRIPEVGAELRVGDQVVGEITSATYSPRLSAPLGLGFVRQAHARPATRLASMNGDAEIIALPVG